MLSPEFAIEPRAWQVEFAESPAEVPEGVKAIRILEPQTITALLAPVTPAEALAPASPAAAGALTLIWMPPSANTPATIERDVAEWMSGRAATTREVNVRAEVRTVRVVWGDGRSVIYAHEGDLPYALDAVLRFSVAQREALRLEEDMRSAWDSIRADTFLTHAITLRDLKKQQHVNHMTEITTDMKITWLRIFRSLEQFDPSIAEPSKRIFAELASAATLYDRLETLENTVQFALDHYEISNTRLIDTYLARTDRINSIYGYGIITILLLIQIWIMLYEAGLI